MSFQVPTSEPTQLIAGDSWKWDVSPSDFPPSEGWQLSYYLRGPQDLSIAWGTEVTASGGTFQVRVPASKTNLVPGTYVLTGRVTDGTDTHSLLDSDGRPKRWSVTVLSNPAVAVNEQSHDEKMLAALDAALEGRITKDMEQLTINGRSLTRIPFEELLRFQGVYRQRVAEARTPDLAFGQVESVFLAPR